MILETDKAYAAGVLDSDGSLGIYYANGSTTRSQVVIAIQDMNLLQWFCDRWGGRIENNGRGQRVNKWVAGTKEIRWQFLYDLLPYLQTKKDIAELVLEYLQSHYLPNEEYVALTRELNSRLSREFIPHPGVKELSTDKQGGE